MSRTPRTPRDCLHKLSGWARVIVDGQHHYLGRFGSPESKRRYAELVNRGHLRQQALLRPELTLGQLALLYVEWAQGYYPKAGKPTTSVAGIRGAVKPLLRMFRAIEVTDFGPLKLREYQERLISQGVQRDNVNRSWTACNGWSNGPCRARCAQRF